MDKDLGRGGFVYIDMPCFIDRSSELFLDKKQKIEKIKEELNKKFGKEK